MIESLLAYGWWVGAICIVIGFVALVKGADWLVDGASAIAKRFGISDLVIGLTVVAFGTSMPEFVVNMVSVAEGSTDLAITNILGSNIINTFVILGLTALVYPIVSQKRSRDFDIPMSIIAGFLVLIFVTVEFPFGECGKGIGRMGGTVLLLMFCYFLYNTFRHAKDHPEENELASAERSNGSPRYSPDARRFCRSGCRRRTDCKECRRYRDTYGCERGDNRSYHRGAGHLVAGVGHLGDCRRQT